MKRFLPEKPTLARCEFAAVLRIWIALGFDNWDKQIACLLRSHAVETERVALNEKQSIDPREHEEVFAFSGWRA